MMRPLLLFLLSLLGACQGPTVVLVSLLGTPQEAGLDRARATLTLDGARLRRQEEFPGPPPRFALRFPPKTTGTLDLLIEGVDRDGCIPAQGQGRTVLGGEDLLEVEVPMSPRAPRRCADRVRVLPGQGSVELTSIALDPQGNVLVAGTLLGDLTLPGWERRSAGPQDGLLAKLSPEGAPIWVRTYGGEGSENIRAMAPHPSGDILITGFYDGAEGICGGGPSRGQDAFLARLGPDGSCRWGVGMGSEGSDAGLAVAADATGAVVATGRYMGSLELDAMTTLPPGPDPGQSDVFLVRHKGDGARQSYTRVELTGADAPNALALDGSGNAYVAGEARNEQQGNDAFVACYTAALNPCGKQWRARSMGPFLHNAATRVLLAPGGDLLVSGIFEGRIDFGGQVLENLERAMGDAFLLRLDGRDLHLLWLRGMGGVGDDGAWGLAQDRQEDIVVCGYAANVSLPGSGRTLMSRGELDIFAARFDKDGAPRWLRGLGGAERDLCWGVALDRQGRAWLAGNFFGDADFGDGEARNAELESDGVVLRLP